MILKRIAVVFVAYSFLLIPVAAQQRTARPQTTTLASSTGARSKARTAFSPSVSTASTDIVISQVYGGGGNAGATYTNDFIELFNLGTTPVVVTGWTVQYASSTGTSWATTALSGTIQAGAHYLVQESAGAGGTTPLPTPDATGSIAMSGTAGKVALVTNSTALTCGGSNNCTSASIKDFVGYGSAATAFETAPTATLTNTTAAIRASNGCVDTDNNSTDFSTGAPNPRNSASSPTPCTGSNDPTGTGSANPNNPATGASVLLTVAVTPGTNPTSTGLTVVSDLTAIAGASDQSFFDDGSHGDATPGDNVFSLATTVGGGVSGGTKTIPFTVSDSIDRSTDGSFQLTVVGPSAPSGIGSASPDTVPAGGSTTLTVTVTPGTIPTSTGITVTADLTSIGGSASQSFTNSGGNSFTFPATVSVATPDGFKSLPFVVTDDQSRTGNGTIGLTVGTNTDPATHTAAEHELMGNPTAAGSTSNDDWLIERTQYVESYNCTKGIPNWVEWHLDSNWLGSAKRQDNYRADTAPPLPTSNCYIVQGGDYSGSGFDRGHNVPSADRTDSVASNSATFLMPNFIPQSPNNNQGPWNNMENYIRTQVTAGNEAYIWMGNAGQGGTGSNGGVTMTIAGGHVVVPSYVWKVVMILPVGSNDVSRVTASTRVFAVLTPNTQTGAGLNGNWMTYICPVSKIEQLTGMNFFPNVAPATAAVLKQTIDSSLVKQTIASGSYSNLTVNFPETYVTGNVTVTGNLTLGPETVNTVDTSGNNFKITLAPGATVTRTAGGMVTGTLEKQYDNSSQSFLYPVGTPNGYSPVLASLNSLSINPSSLSVQAVQGPEPHATASTALQRYWTLNETGDLSANLTFNYLDIDVPSGTTESSLKLNKYDTFFSQVPATLDTNANTVTTNSPVSEFSNWALLPNVPTAATVSVAGRVVDTHGNGVRNARVVFEDQYGHTTAAITNAFGYYQLNDIQSGSTFVASVTVRGVMYQQRLVQVFDSLTDVNFSPQ